MVAYGDGIRADGMEAFDELAIVGSCEKAGDEDCESTIVARTPEELQTELQQRIRQILAQRLAFTAPSITATIQEGGSLYQAQFSYEQHGEWQGTILRKTLNPDGTVEHDMNFPGNWSAAEQVRLKQNLVMTLTKMIHEIYGLCLRMYLTLTMVPKLEQCK